LLLFPVVAVVFAVESTLTLANASTMNMSQGLPPMPKDCTTPATMDSWYATVARQNLQVSHSPADCKAELLGLGATPSVAGKACS
jgi:hypothetical protein